ncbi:MAG: ABC transporter substrate-binding protein [Tissierellia bacterium]|nr:ABC transporter substrate-binding protein [Tissierellia bacterium]
MTKKRISLLLALTLAMSVVFTACAPTEDPAETPAETPGQEQGEEPSEEPTGTLKVGITEASGNFNPLYYSSAYDGYVVDLIFQSLATLNYEGTEYIPSVAKDWDISEDGKTITFNLREDIVFSDGTPLTANDVVFTYKVLADPSYDGRYGTLVQDLEGYEEYFNKETEEFKGVVADGDYKVTFNFAVGYRTNFANAMMSIMPESYYGEGFTYGDTTSLSEKSAAPVGSGPYKLENYTEAQFIFLTRNMEFADDGYMIKEILMQFVDQSTDIVQLMSEEVDLLNGVIEPAKIKEARDGNYGANEYPRSGYGYINFNTEAGPTKEVAVRQALTYAFDTEGFVNSFYKDEETGIVLASNQNHPFSQVSWVIDDALVSELTDYSYDIEKAKSILEEAGWMLNSDGVREKDGQLLELNIAAMPDHNILSVLIPMWEKAWNEELGVKLNVAYLEFNTMLDYVIYDSDNNVDKWSVFFLATSITSPDPDSLYNEFHSSQIGSNKDNTARYNNPEVDKLFDEAKSILDVEEAKPVYAKIAKILNDEVPKVVVYANTYFDLYNPKLTDFKTASLYNWTKALKDARIVE